MHLNGSPSLFSSSFACHEHVEWRADSEFFHKNRGQGTEHEYYAIHPILSGNAPANARHDGFDVLRVVLV